MKKSRKPIMIKSGNYKTRIIAMMCCRSGAFSRH